MADYQYITSKGIVTADTSDLQATVEAEFKAALGQDLDVTPSTPQGALITAEVLARSSMLDNNAALANQINPNIAGGVFLDAIWALTGGARLAATKSYITGVTLGGLAGVLVPAGSQVSTADGTLFTTDADATLNGAGEATVNVTAVDYGPVAVSVGGLDTVVTGVLGWDTVYNSNAAVVGRDVETDLRARQRRKQTLSLQNVALPEAITSGLYDTEGVRSLQFRENPTPYAATIDGIDLDPHSVWVCVEGGTDEAVAATLLREKSLGCAWVGSESVNVVHPSSGQTYAVLFDRPVVVPVRARVTVRNTTSVTDVPSAVRDAIVSYAAGLQEGEPGFVVGNSVSAYELAGAVNRDQPAIYVKSAEVSLASPTSWVQEVELALNELASIVTGNIEVIVV